VKESTRLQLKADKVQREIEKLVVRSQAQAVGKLNDAEELAAQAWQREMGTQSEPDANAPEAKRQAGQTTPGNRITNLPRLYGCYAIILIRQMSASLPPSDTGGPKFSPVATLWA